MKFTKILKMFGIYSLLFLFVAGILSLTIKGVKGNPSPTYIFNNLRSVTKPFELSPERGRYALVLSIAENKSLYFPLDIARMALPDLGYRNGQYVSLFAPGVSTLAVPFYLVGKYFGIGQVGAFSISSLFAILNVLLITAIVAKLTKNRWAGIAASLTFLFASSAWAYAGTLYQHHISTFLLLAAIALLVRPVKWFTALLVGLLFSVAIAIDYPNAIFFIPYMLYLVFQHIEVEQKAEKVMLHIKFVILTVIIGIAIGILPQLYFNKIAYGNPFTLAGGVQSVTDAKDVSTSGPHFVSTTNPNAKIGGFFKESNLPNSAYEILTSPDRGVLFFFPVIIMSFFGFLPLFKKHKSLAIALGGGIASIVILYSFWGDPGGGWAFGERYMIPAISQLAIVLGVAIATYGKKVWFALLYFLLLVYSLSIALVGALATNRIPPKAEAVQSHLPYFNYFLDIHLLQKGITSSFVYNTFLQSHISLQMFATTLSILAIGSIVISYTMAIHQKKD